MIRVSLALICLALTVQPVRADTAAAEKLAADASTAAAAGNFKKAAETFALAFKEDPSRTDVFCNIGISYFKAGSLPRAHVLLSQCIERSSLDLAFKDNARSVITSIEETLRKENHAPITLRPDPKNAIVVIVPFGLESEFSGTRTVWLPFGPNQVEVRAEGFLTELFPVVISEQAPKTVELRLKPKPGVDVPPPQKPGVTDSSPFPKWPAIATSVLTVGAVLIAVISYRQAQDAAESGGFAVDVEAEESSPFPYEVSKYNLMLGISGTTAIVAGAASGYLWYRATRSPSTSVEVQPTAGGAAVTFRGRF